jgi:hypothetical protein
MADVLLPFPEERIDYRKISRGDDFLRGFPKDLREAALEKPFLAAYLAALPIDEIGIPDYYPTPDRSLGKLERRNLIYPIRKGNFVHIFPDEQSERDYYVVIEPTLGINLNGISRESEVQQKWQKQRQAPAGHTPGNGRDSLHGHARQNWCGCPGPAAQR